MYLQANLMAIVPNSQNSTAYFYCNKKKCVLPVIINNETSFALIVSQQKLLFELYENYAHDTKSNASIKSLIITAEMLVEEEFLDKRAIKVTKELIKKSLIKSDC